MATSNALNNGANTKNSPASSTLRGRNGSINKRGGVYSAPLSFRIPNGRESQGGKKRTPPGGFDGMHPLPPQFPRHMGFPRTPIHHSAQQVHSEHSSYPNQGSRPQQPPTSWMKVRGSARTQSEPVSHDEEHGAAARGSDRRPSEGAVVQHDAQVGPPDRRPAQAARPEERLREMETARAWAGDSW